MEHLSHAQRKAASQQQYGAGVRSRADGVALRRRRATAVSDGYVGSASLSGRWA
jgi:hypothetical protein